MKSFTTMKSFARTQGRAGLLAGIALALLATAASADSITKAVRQDQERRGRLALHPHQCARSAGEDHQLRRHRPVHPRPRPARAARRCRAGLRFHSPLREGQPVLRRAHRALRQPDRQGRFTLDGQTYKLFVNNGPNSLHGGKVGFDKKVWTAVPVKHPGGVGLALSYLSKDGEEGYPGNLDVTVVYTWTDDDALRIVYTAKTDKDTVFNPTNHSYFNLNGAGNGTVLDTRLMINADRFSPVDKTQIPLGPSAPVAGTPFDFRRPHAIGARINEKDAQLATGSGYDHNFVINGSGYRMAVRAYSPRSGRVLTEYTDQPGVQLYTSNFLTGTLKGKGGKTYAHRGAFALEAQHFPDSPNHPQFPTTELKPGETYHQTTVYQFSVR